MLPLIPKRTLVHSKKGSQNQLKYAVLMGSVSSAGSHDPILIRTLPGRRAQRPLIRCACVGDYFASKVSQIDESGANRKKNKNK